MWGDVHEKLKQLDVTPTIDAERAYKSGFEDGVRFMKSEFVKKLAAIMDKNEAEWGSRVWRS